MNGQKSKGRGPGSASAITPSRSWAISPTWTRPRSGKTVKQFDFLTGIESVKAASDIYAPLSGTIRHSTTPWTRRPELVNKSCYADGWIAEIEISDPGETKNLMNAAAYKEYAAGLE